MSEIKTQFIDIKTNPNIKNDRRNIDFYFPINNKIKSISNLNPINISNLKLTLEGTYSITRPDQGAQFVDYAKKYNFSKYDLVDGTAGLGGDLIYMSQFFKNVTAIEFNPLHAIAIKDNCAEYGYNINVIVNDFTNIYKSILNKNTILWLDPPWGGPEIWNSPNLKLHFYGEKKIYVNKFIEDVFSECKIPMCILKCPNLTYLEDLKLKFDIIKTPIKRTYPPNMLGKPNYQLYQLVTIKPKNA